LGAKGQIGKTLVPADWKGVKYARQYTVPANPRTASQMATRNVFSMLNGMWLVAPTLFRAPWDANAVGRQYTNRNKLMAENVSNLIGETDMNLFIASPGALGGPPLDSLVAATGAGAAGTIEGTAVAPTPPTGWTLTGVTFAAFPDQDPADPFLGPLSAAQDTTSTYVQSLTGLPAGVACQVVAWPGWVRPDGRTAYGASLIDQATSHA